MGVFVGCFDGYRMVVFVVVVVLILLSVFLLEMRDMMGIICNNGPLLFFRRLAYTTQHARYE